mmetsp:Transcript_30446/g.69219  ORF Transcript_30446/g.69219 Transcript_30446/m.69219 type:complete len:202 (+) Transcript_30446:95-700(+)
MRLSLGGAGGSVALRVEEDGAPLEEGLRTAICNVLLDHRVLKRRRLLLQDALAAGIEGGERGQALHLPSPRRLTEALLHAPQVGAAGKAAGVVEVRSVLEGFRVHLSLHCLGVRAEGVFDLRLALDKVRPEDLLRVWELHVGHGQACEVAAVERFLERHVPLHGKTPRQEPVLQLRLDEGNLLLAVLLVPGAGAHAAGCHG